MKIAIAGYGVEGEANYAYWSKDLANDITIVDQSETPGRPVPEGATTILAADAFEHLDGFDMVIRTAGLAPYKIKTDGKIWSGTNEFFAKCPAPIIGVTGTKGKGTTSTMITSILKATSRKVWLVGNIGLPSLDILAKIQPEDIVVYELSSFQLWDLETSPHIAVVLPVEPEHLDVHRDYDDYVNAKSNIRRYQKADDVCVYHGHNDVSRQISLASDRGTRQRYDVPDDDGVYAENGAFKVGEEVLFPTSTLSVPGQHNVENACAAITVARLLGIETHTIQEGLSAFEGLPHRIEHVRTLDGVEYYNDSFSSNPSSTHAAMASFTKPEIVIVGGVDRGADFGHLVRDVLATENVKEIILIGEVREKLAAMFKDADTEGRVHVTVSDAKTIDEVVAYARSVAEAGDVVLLSPACASFDMFLNFYDRGEKFKEAVHAL